MDVIDRLVTEWGEQRPDLSTAAMGVVGRMIRLGRRFHDEANALLLKSGLTYSDFDVLATLRRAGAPHVLSPKELQQNVVLTSGAMTACLIRLERGGLIVRGCDSTDGRKRTVMLTPDGISLVDSIIVERFALADREIAALKPNDRERLTSLLRALGN
jgi:DNA-binding MarR family transcriptional regulator